MDPSMCMCRRTPPLNQLLGSPSLPVVARCSLVGCRLMDESPLSSSVKAPLYQAAVRTGTSHLIRSQWKPVAPCHHSYSTGPRCNSDSHRCTELDALRKPFRCKDGILCESCPTLFYMGGTAIGWTGDIVWGILRRAEYYGHPSWVMFRKTSSEMLSIKSQNYSPKLHMNEREDVRITFSTQKISAFLALSWLQLTFFLPLFHLPSRSVGIYMSMTSVWVPFSLTLSFLLLLFFVRYLHVIGFCCLMVLRWNESNLLSDSQAILPAITLIHSGQWIIMTMKPGSCEEILQALMALV